MVLPNFVRQALAGEPITVFGDGKQSRCFCHVKDSVEAVLRLIATPAAIGEVVNVGNTHEISIENLAQLVKQRTGSNSPIVHIPYDQAYEPGFEDMPRRVPALGKLKQLTGFAPSTTLNEIVDSVIDYFRSRREVTTIHPEAAAHTAPAKSSIPGRAAAGSNAD